MRRLTCLAVATIMAAGFTFSARAAAPILSASTAVNSESDLFTGGTEVFGGDDNGYNATLANGLNFVALQNATFIGTSLSGVTVDTDGSYYGGHANTSAFSDGALNNVLGGDSLGNYGQVFVNGLTTGQTYVIQLFAEMTQGGDIGGGFNNPSSTYSGTERVQDITQGGTTYLSFGQTLNPLTGQYTGTGVDYITDTFTATGSQEYLYIDNSTSGVNLVGAVLVTALPEPSTYALMGLGLLGLVGLRRFHLQS